MKPQTTVFQGSAKLQTLSMSLIRTFMDRSKAMAASGLPVVSFVAGEPDFHTPQAIKDAACKAIQENYTHYTSNKGFLPLRQVISEKMQEETGLSYDPETEILVTSGGAEAINNALLAVLDPGDEVIVFSPAFVNYENVSKICGAKVVSIPLREENRFQIDVQEVRGKITEKTKLIVVNNPCNPTGVLYTEQTLRELSALICEKNLLAFSDEIYSRLVYGDCRFCSLASFPGMKERTIVMNGFSKTYAMTGWRLGFLCAPKDFMPALVKVHQYSTTCSPTFIQVALAQALRLESTRCDVQRMIDAFAGRRALVMRALDSVKQLRYVKPDGAFYFFVNVSGTGLSGEEFANRLLEEKYVATVPGVGLGKECGAYIRISYAAGEQEIQEGMRRILQFVEEQKQ